MINYMNNHGRIAMTNTPPFTLGLDIGMASVGAALLTDSAIRALHVRTFDKAETDEKGESLNKIRRDARLTRRRIRRRAFRLLRLRRLLTRMELISDSETALFETDGLTPWTLRAEGLDRVLTDPEWAAVIYHLVKHRGFQSNRKSEAATDEKAGQMLSGIASNHTKMTENGYRTVGEMAAKDPDFAMAKRNKGGSYTHTFARADVCTEAARLFECQRQQGNSKASVAFEQQVNALLLARRPTLSGEDLLKMVGQCTFEPAEFRAPKASYSAERFIWLGKLNNLKLSVSGESRPLTDAERQQVIDLPFTQSKLTFKQLRKTLDLPEHVRFNLVAYRNDGKNPEDASFFEAKAYHAIRKAYASAQLQRLWQRDAIDSERLDVLAYALTCFKDDNESRAYLSDQGIEPDIIEAVLTLSFDQFIRLSRKALCAILPYMEQGEHYDSACESAGYHHSQPGSGSVRTRFLSAPDRDTIRNPVVYRALNQARKLVNAIIREYGPPAAVHIELARDLSKPFDERQKIRREQSKFQEAKAEAREQFEDTFKTEANGLDLQKWRLYREQGGQCAYSLKSIDITRLLEAGYVEVDHALPYSRSFDDSQNNKVLVLTVENRNKGNRTPFEYLDGASDSERWRLFEAWVQSNKSIRQAKRNRLLRRHFGGEESSGFRDRNLNDTRYICREFKYMIDTQLEWHPDAASHERCVVVAGQLTSLLRARWGLIKIREDGDLHHALDAAVIAACNRSLVKRMADYSRRGELSQIRDSYLDPETGEILDLAAIRRLEDVFPTPWPHFRQDLLARLSSNPNATGVVPGGELAGDAAQFQPVRVSRAPSRRGLGAAHEATVRSVGKEGKWIAQNQSSIRTPLTNLKLKDLENMVGYNDPRNESLVALLRSRLQQHGGDGAKAFGPNQPPVYKPSGEGKTAPLIRSVKLFETRKSGLPVRHGIAKNGSMIRIDLFSKKGKFFAVPIYVADVARKELPNRAVVAYKPEGEWPEMDDTYEFMFSLYPNDWVKVLLKSEVKEGYFSGLDRATGAISLWVHDRNQHVGKKGQWRGIGIKTAKLVEKYHVDLLGNLRRARNEKRKPVFRNDR